MLDKKKILIIGIDGGTWTVLNPAIEQGYMPFLKQLCDNGASGILESTIPAITPAAWGAFQTGKNPGKTGMFHFLYWDKKDKKQYCIDSWHLGETIWEILSRNGKRVAVINVPMTYPPREINGILVSGLMTPSMESDFCWPPSFKSQLLNAVPQYHIFDMNKISNIRAENENLPELIRQITSIIEYRTQAALWILHKEPFDVFMVHFQATDVLQHVYWNCLDETHPRFQATQRQVVFEKFYHVLDQEIKRIYEAFTEINGEPLTILLSDHGFQSHFKRFNLGNWLHVQGYLKFRSKARETRVPFLKKISKRLRVGKLLSYFLSQSVIQSIDKKYLSNSDFIEWKDSLAYSIGKSSEGFIYLLSEPERLAEEIKQKLAKLKDPQTGRPFIKKIWLKQELYHGDKMDIIPDIVVEPEGGYTCTGQYIPGQGLFHTVTPKEDMHIGQHHQEGMIVLSGPEIVHRPDIYASIMDIAPTVLYYLGCPVPASMDGHVLKNLLSDKIECNAKETIAKTSSPQKRSKGYTEEDETEIEKRLRDLGYL